MKTGMRKERIDRGIKIRSDGIYALSSWREISYLIAPRALLVGARAVQVASSIYRNGLEQIHTMLNELDQWMEKQGFVALDEVIGKLSGAGEEDTALFDRFQYIKGLVGIQ